MKYNNIILWIFSSKTDVPYVSTGDVLANILPDITELWGQCDLSSCPRSVTNCMILKSLISVPEFPYLRNTKMVPIVGII